MKSYEEKVDYLKELFSSCANAEAKYRMIMELGKKQPLLNPSHKILENVVKGCQSTMYLYSVANDGMIHFQAESDALISSGLAAVLVLVYSGETPEIILKRSPTYLEELEISQSLTPSRSNGLYSIHLRMKQEALKWLMTMQTLS